MSKTDILKQLKEQLILFFDELIDTLPDEPDLIIIRIFIKDKYPVEDIMKYLMKKFIPLRNGILKEDEGFFLNNNILFEEMDNTKVNHFKRIWRSETLSEDDRKVIWKWFKGFLYLAEKYEKIL
jgi:hypothetical protein